MCNGNKGLFLNTEFAEFKVVFLGVQTQSRGFSNINKVRMLKKLSITAAPMLTVKYLYQTLSRLEIVTLRMIIIHME